jgi:hypothetical protein
MVRKKKIKKERKKGSVLLVLQHSEAKPEAETGAVS